MRVLFVLPLLAALLVAIPAAQAATLGIVAPASASEEATRILRTIQSAAEEKEWRLRTVAGPGAIARLVEAGPVGIVLVMGGEETGEAELAAARSAGIPVVTVLSGARPGAVFDLGVNEYAVGADIGAYLLGLIGERGRLIMLRADSDPAARARARVVELMLQDAPGVPVIASVQRAPGDGWEEGFRRELDGILALTGPGPLAVWAASDALALVAEEVLRARGWDRDRLTLVSVGGSRGAFDRLAEPEGLLAATLAIPYELLGEAAVDVIDDLAAGVPPREISAGPYLFIDTLLVDRDNVPREGGLPW